MMKKGTTGMFTLWLRLGKIPCAKGSTFETGMPGWDTKHKQYADYAST
jgi:hypothetical protein